VVPAGQGFCAFDVALVVHDGLVVHVEVAAREALAQVGFQAGAFVQGLLHAGVEEAVGVAPGGFGFVHGQVCALEQFVHALAFGAKEGQADAGGAVVLLAGQFEGLVQRHEEFARDGFGLAAGGLGILVQAFEQDDEFVAAKACNGVAFAHAGREAGGDLDQELVAHVVAQGVVEVFEVVQVDEQQRAVLARALAAEQQALQAVQQQAAVGQGREGVVERQAFDLLAARLRSVTSSV
jgi:hypothetical protein